MIKPRILEHLLGLCAVLEIYLHFTTATLRFTSKLGYSIIAWKWGWRHPMNVIYKYILVR